MKIKQSLYKVITLTGLLIAAIAITGCRDGNKENDENWNMDYDDKVRSPDNTDKMVPHPRDTAARMYQDSAVMADSMQKR